MTMLTRSYNIIGQEPPASKTLRVNKNMCMSPFMYGSIIDIIVVSISYH